MKVFHYCFLSCFLLLSFSIFAQDLNKKKEYAFLEQFIPSDYGCALDIYDPKTHITFLGDSLWQNPYALDFLQERVNSNDLFAVLETFPALVKLKRYDLIEPYLYSDYERVLLRAIKALGTSGESKLLTVLINRLHDPFPREYKSLVVFPETEEVKKRPAFDRSDVPRAAIFQQLQLYASLEHLPALEKLLIQQNQKTDWTIHRLQDLERLIAFLQDYQKVQGQPYAFYQKLLASKNGKEQTWAYHKIQLSQNLEFLPLIRDFVERKIALREHLSDRERYYMLMKRKKCGEFVWSEEEQNLIRRVEADLEEIRQARKTHIAKVRAEIYAE